MSAAPELVRIPPGTFLMGAGGDDKFATSTERPVHRVPIERAFWLGRNPITVAEYRDWQPCHDASADPEWPVVNVSWYDAGAYCVWLSERTSVEYRLPSEEEWEYACRAGCTQPFHSGDSLALEDANYLYSEQGERIGRGARTAIGVFPPNRFQLHDMHGNVCEWVRNRWRRNYAAEAPTDDPLDRRVIRGGAWDQLPRLLRSAWRDGIPAVTRCDNIGFRVAADLEG